MSKAATLCAVFCNTGASNSNPTWTRICKSTALTISQNPETEDFDYIADEVKTTEVKAYAPTLDQDLAILKDEPDFQWFWAEYLKRNTGADAHKRFLIVYLHDGNKDSGYYAENWEGVLSFTDYNAVDAQLNYSIAFCGTPEIGKATVNSNVATFTKTATEG